MYKSLNRLANTNKKSTAHNKNERRNNNMHAINNKSNHLPKGNNQKSPLAVYIHWGFCRRKCPYCDFMSRTIPDVIDFDLWLNEYKKSFDFYSASADSRDFYLSSIFFGGGTPSLLPAYFIEQLINYIQSKYHSSSNIEISLEANPYKLTSNYLKDINNAGVNRLSLGVQSFNDKELHFLGRLHDSREAISALENTMSIFKNFSFDLIYALPSQTPDSWEKSLDFALQFQPPHLSLYQLTVEPPSLFYKQKIQTVNESTALDLYNLTLDLTEQAGIPAYEVSNHAVKGFKSIHNCAYWSYQSYIGIGPSAAGRITVNNKTLATLEKPTPMLWLKSKNKNKDFITLSPKEVRMEKIIMGMRLKTGIDVSLVNQKSLNELTGQGLVHTKNNKVSATRKGLFVLNQVIEQLT